jgi:hypothetical protein
MYLCTVSMYACDIDMVIMSQVPPTYKEIYCSLLQITAVLTLAVAYLTPDL